MIKEWTALQLIDRIRAQCGNTWKTSAIDVFNAGNPDTPVTGIATSYTPSINVLQKAVATGNNLLITQQPAYYGETDDYLKSDPAYLYKKEFIAKNNLVVWRFEENWNALRPDGQLLGLAKALGWETNHLPYIQLPETPLRKIIPYIEQRLAIKGIRVIGDPDTTIHKAALSTGVFQFTRLQQFLRDAGVDLIIAAEAIEWESPEYFRDLLTWKGKNKAMILLGREASEDPGYGLVASWLKTFIPELPIDWLPAGEPFLVPHSQVHQ